MPDRSVGPRNIAGAAAIGKGYRTPQKAGMALVKQPDQIGIHAKHRLMAGDAQVWDKYLFC
jgi:hypothetical protein